ncbi:MAG: hypothetical protein WCK65_07920 [Rhodospirillaceae bacterium]
MPSVLQEDVTAVHRGFAANGRVGAMAELRRRWLVLNDVTAPEVLDRILAMDMTPPRVVAAKSEPRPTRARTRRPA